MTDVHVTDVGPARDEGGRAHIETGHGGGHGEAGHDTTTGLSNNKLGMWLFLGSECLLFGGLISTYMLYRVRRTSPCLEADTARTMVSELISRMNELIDVTGMS